MIHSEHLEAPGNAILENNNDGRVEEFRKLAKAAKKHGSIFIGQISHPGRQARSYQSIASIPPITRLTLDIDESEPPAKPRLCIRYHAAAERHGRVRGEANTAVKGGHQGRRGTVCNHI